MSYALITHSNKSRRSMHWVQLVTDATSEHLRRTCQHSPCLCCQHGVKNAGINQRMLGCKPQFIVGQTVGKLEVL